MSARPYLFTHAIEALARAVMQLEDNRDLHFACLGFDNALSHDWSAGGWHETGLPAPLGGLPDMRTFAADLNAAITPVKAAYAKKLRQELANECVKLASLAIAKPEPL